MTRIDYANGGVQVLAWDGLGRLVSAESVRPADSAIPLRRSNSYDANHHVVAEKSDDHTVQFETDAAGASRDDR
jgi:hypothetical protein